MTAGGRGRIAGPPARRATALGALLVPALLLGACSQVPDWANPGEWLLESEPAEATAVSAQPPGEDGGEAAGETDEGFPNLASVPEAPRRPSSREHRRELSRSLAADRGEASYSDQPLRAEEAEQGAAGPAVGEAVDSGELPQAPQAAEDARGEAAAADGGSPTTGSASGGTEATTSTSQAAPRGPRMLKSERGEPVRVVRSESRRQTMPAEAPEATREEAASESGTGAVQTSRPPAASGTVGGQVAVIYFGHGSAGLDSRDRQVLRDVAGIQRQRGGTLRVVGHASGRAAAKNALRRRLSNFEMSLRRAEAVAEALEDMGVPGERIVVEARSANEPVYQETAPSGEAGNRRAEIFLQSSG